MVRLVPASLAWDHLVYGRGFVRLVYDWTDRKVAGPFAFETEMIAGVKFIYARSS